jgi:hypothetical protein
MNKLQKTAARFAKILNKVSQVTSFEQDTVTAYPTGYGAISNIYNIAKQMKNETKKFQEDSVALQQGGTLGIAPRVNDIFQNASKFVWNAAYNGITASQSAKYHGLINQTLTDLIAYANSKKSLDESMLARSPYEANIYTTTLTSANKLAKALANFVPVSVPAQLKQKPKAPATTEDTATSVPFAYQGQAKKYNPFAPSVNVPSGPARISNQPEIKLPLSERERELEPWKI